MHWLGDNHWAAWLAIAAVLGVAELASMDFVLVMLAIGAMGATLVALITDSIIIELVVALGIAFALLALVRPPMLRRLHDGPELRIGPATLIGRQVITAEQISAHHPGQIRIDGEQWTAQPYDDQLVIQPGETVEVLAIRGATAYVHPVPTLGSPLGEEH